MMMDEPLVRRAGSASGLFRHAIAAVRALGSAAALRGLPTMEVSGVMFQMARPRERFVHLPPARVLNPAHAAAETVAILAGAAVASICDHAGGPRGFADHGIRRRTDGARMRSWGPAGLDQLARAVEVLVEDPDSRRAVIQLYDPTVDGGDRQAPCTLSHRFRLRHGRLHMSTTVRSQDAWLGLPRDLFSATVIQELVAGWVDAELGTYNLSIDSLHLRDVDLERAAIVPLVKAGIDSAPGTGRLPELAVPFDDLDSILAAVIDGRVVDHPGWDQLGATMRSYRSWHDGRPGEARRIAAAISDPLRRYLTSWYDTIDTSWYDTLDGIDSARPGV